MDDLDKVLMDCKHDLDQEEKEDEEFSINDDTNMTVLIKMAPKDHVKDIREKHQTQEFTGSYHRLEQQNYMMKFPPARWTTRR